MSQKTIGFLVGVIVIVLAGFAAWEGSIQAAVPSSPGGGTALTDRSPSSSGNQGGSSSSSSSRTYTLADVAAHSDSSSCWSAIDGGVYDLTAWISRHPGGWQAILSICGVDGSDAFHAQHDHAPRQENLLAGMQIGTLVQ